jgi:hypothetical protein
MANAGTLLSDLDGKQPISGDSDLVNMIYQDMSAQEGQGAGGPPGGIQHPGVMQMPPPQLSTNRIVMDNGPPTSHVIGGQHPTPADFANMVQSTAPGFPAGGNWAPASSGPSQAQIAAQIASMQASQGKAWSNMLAGEVKIPLLIAILVFVINLPFLSVLVAHYAPWMLKPSGDMNLYGQLAKALIVGLLFWGSNRVILPLLG